MFLDVARRCWQDCGARSLKVLGFTSRAVVLATALTAGAAGALAKGGTAKPPDTPAVPAVVILPPAGPSLPSLTPLSNGFSITGFIQALTCDANGGGTVTINGLVITIPANLIVQFPANTFAWVDAACPPAPTPPALTPSIALDGTGGISMRTAQEQRGPIYSSIEMRVEGNIVAGPGGPAAVGGAGAQYIAALAYVSQQSLNSGSGYISSFDYSDGSIYVNSSAGLVRLILNDPFGRFGRPRGNTDVRFSVDDANPTIKASSGYPMCVPRLDPAVQDDPRCPQKNRPTANCRTFAAAGFVPVGGDLSPTPVAGWCRAFVMKALTGYPGAATASLIGIPGSAIAGPDDPDPRQQAPFVLGDFITWSGTLVRGKTGNLTTTTPDTIWVHTIEANVGIYTQPSTLPAYIAIGEFVVGVEPQPPGAVAIVGGETTDRLVLEAATTDIGSIVDVYFDDKGFSLPQGNTIGPLTSTVGGEYFRWLTLESMTGTLTEQLAGTTPFIISAQPFGGGIQTQFVGPVPGRARIRANKAPAIDTTGQACPATAGSQHCSITQSPTRYVRAVLRSLCAPAATGAVGTNGATVGTTNIDNGTKDINGIPKPDQFYDINGTRPDLPHAGPRTSRNADRSLPPGSCLESAQFANGLFTGQYMAPVGEFIFQENTLNGAPILPSQVWQLGFAVYGEGGRPGASSAPLTPQPW